MSVVVALALAVAAADFAAAQLPRRTWLGVQTQTAASGGTQVVRVAPGSTAAALGIRPGDRLVDDALSRRWRHPASLPRAGDRVALQVRRDGHVLELTGAARARPFEAYEGGDVRYGEVAFNGGRLRDILVTPHGVSNPPVVFLIQGYNCGSMEAPAPGMTYHRIGAELIKAGIAYYRVEKAGMGDSDGGTPCQLGDFGMEMDGFRTAYRHLVAGLGFSLDRVFLFGHSMGGIEAPMLAAETAPRGVAVYGVIVRNWCDYWHSVDGFQDFVKMGGDPVSGYLKGEANREIFRRFCFAGESPVQIAAAAPNLREPMRAALEWDGADQVAGRHYRYFQQLAAANIVAAWAHAKTSVLSLSGESDVETLSGDDQQLLVEIVNHYRPGTARFVRLAGTDHWMNLVGSRDTARAMRRGGGLADDAFNVGVTDILVSWVRSLRGETRQ